MRIIIFCFYLLNLVGLLFLELFPVGVKLIGLKGVFLVGVMLSYLSDLLFLLSKILFEGAASNIFGVFSLIKEVSLPDDKYK